MSLVLHISDTHFGTERPSVLEALVRLGGQLKPELVVFSGDITQRARDGQFRAARACTDRLGAPLLAVPGNHDIPLFNVWARLRRPYAGYEAAFGGDLEPVHVTSQLVVVGVNTTRAWRHKNGEISMGQIERVAQLLERAEAKQLRVVVVHQPIAVTRSEDLSNRLRGHAAALQRWAAAGADIVMGGHIHLPYVLALQGLARPMWAVQAGTAVSSRVRQGAPNSVNVLRWGQGAAAGQCEIARWDCLDEGRGFECAQVTLIRPARSRGRP